MATLLSFSWFEVGEHCFGELSMVVPFIGYSVALAAGIKFQICCEKKGNETFHFIPSLYGVIRPSHYRMHMPVREGFDHSSFDLDAVSVSK